MDEISTIVRSHDRDRYLAALFVPEAKRAHVMALNAFTVEISRIAAQVSAPQLAEIRLQWWLDTLDSIYHGDAQSHPVAVALAAAISEGDIPKHALANFAKAHAFDFYADPMPTLHDLEGYLGETQSAQIRMAAMIMDKDAALECGEAAGLYGVAYGIARLLADLPRSLALKQCFLPKDMMLRREIDPRNPIAPKSTAGLMVLLAELRAHAQTRLNEARASAWTIKHSTAAAFLQAALTPAYLSKAARKGTALTTQGAEIGALRKQWLIWRAAKSETF